MTTASNIALGASLEGFGISSVRCNTTSNPISERADCNKPRIQATPSDQPVSLLKSVKTFLASVFSDMDRRMMLIMTTDKMDQYTASLVRYFCLHKAKLGTLVCFKGNTYKHNHSNDPVFYFPRYYRPFRTRGWRRRRDMSSRLWLRRHCWRRRLRLRISTGL